MADQHPLITPNSENPLKPTIDRDIDRNGTGENDGRQPSETKIQDKPKDPPALPDPTQEKPELAPLVLAQLDPDAGFNGA